MPFLPAVCNSCYTVFSSGIYVRKSQLHLFGYKASPCPRCNSNGFVREGVYKFVGYTLSILKSEHRSISELAGLHESLVLARDNQVGQEHLEAIIKREYAGYLDLLLLLPKKKQDYQLCLHLMAQIVIAVVKISLQEGQRFDLMEQPIRLYQDIKVNQIIEQIYTNNTGVERRLF